MAEQTYATHRQLVPMYHVVTFFLLVAILIGSAVNLWRTIGSGASPYSASLILALTVAVFFVYVYSRVFALKAQDRAIRAEEQLRHYVLTGALLDRRLTVRQIVGLRFASDAEFVALAKRAAEDNMAPEAIKKAVKAWRPDTYRA
jgi:membrane protein YdbS with pleckstrin-like domain